MIRGYRIWLDRISTSYGTQPYTGSVMRDNAEGYKAQIETAKKAGEPIYQHDKNQLSNALKARAEAEAEAVAEAVAQEEEAAKSKTGKKELVHA